MPSWKKVIVSGSAASLSTLTTSGAVTSKGNLQVRKSFPDIALRADNEQRLNFVDDGNAIQSGIKNNAGTMKFYGDSSSNKIRLTLNDTVAEFDGNVSGSATSTGSFGRVQVTTIAGNSPLTIESPTLSGDTDINGNLTVTGDITAQNYIVSSSVTSITYQSLSGSTIFGDSSDDTHQFTGSQSTTGTGSFGAGYIDNKLGIGTTSPDEGLHLKSKNILFERAGYDTGDQIKWKVGGNDRFTLRFDTTAGGLLFYNEHGSIGNHLFLDRLEAHVGIGTTTPTSELTVQGDISASGDFLGSSTSTGSFGTIQSTTATIPTLLGNTTVDATPNANFTVKDTGSNPIRLQLNNASSTSNFQALEFLDSSGTEGYIRYTHGDDEMTFAGKGTAGVMLTLDSSGNAIFAGSKISGSSTSTGSFGAGYIDNKLGIGTTSPVEALHVAGKAYVRRTGTATAHGDTDLFVADSTAGGSYGQIQILGGASGASLLYFSDTNSYSVGGIRYFHSDNRMNFRANDTDILDITSTKISGSATSTGSFGHVMQDGKGLLPQFTTGSSIFIGENAGASDDGSNNRNIGIGKNALDAATTGQLNIAIGDDALTDVTTGNYNVAIGFESQKDTTGGQNVSVGYNSLEFNTSGNNNVAIGYAAAGGFTYSGISNIAIGFSALGGASVSGDYNIAIGHSVMGSITTADDNLGIGDFVLTSIQTSTRNIAIGSEALRYIKDVGGTHGFNNTALGWNAGKRYGDSAGNLISASYGVFIGHTTYPLENDSQNEILIGSQVRGKGSNTATIGDGNITDIYLSQDQGATVHTGNVSGSSTSTGSFGHIVTAGHIVPTAAESFDLGTADKPFRDLHVSSGSIKMYAGDEEIARIQVSDDDEFEFFSTKGLSKEEKKTFTKAQIRSNATPGKFRGGNIGGNKVSGSATSTGSFGYNYNAGNSRVAKQLVFGNTSEGFDIFQENHEAKLTAYSSGVKSAEIHLQSRAAGDGYSRGGILFRTATHQHSVSGPKDAVYINLSGSVELMRDGANLSGSSTSTGSFGNIQVAQDILPTTDNNTNLGSPSKRFANIHSADLQLSNEDTKGNDVDGTTGNWTLQEGEEDIFLINNKTGKKYSIMLKEVKQ